MYLCDLFCNWHLSRGKNSTGKNGKDKRNKAIKNYGKRYGNENNNNNKTILVIFDVVLVYLSVMYPY